VTTRSVIALAVIALAGRPFPTIGDFWPTHRQVLDQWPDVLPQCIG
jgi:hypothetical protein